MNELSEIIGHSETEQIVNWGEASIDPEGWDVGNIDAVPSAPGNGSGWDAGNKISPPVVTGEPVIGSGWDTVDADTKKLVADPDPENFWAFYGEWFESRGYKLQQAPPDKAAPQNKKKKNKKGKQLLEDNNDSTPLMMTAMRISEGDVVQLKKISLPRQEEEYSIATYFSSELLASDPQNHCVPVFEVIGIPEDEGVIVLAMPIFQHLSEVKFAASDDCIEFFRQLFEGIQFMHKNSVAHRNCTLSNIRVQHPPKTLEKSKLSETPEWPEVLSPPKYYLDNLELSRRYDIDEKRPVKDIPVYNFDKTVPEFQGDKFNEHCDPFAVDIYCIGNVIKTHFIDLKRGVDFMLPLVADMIQDNPLNRPTIDDVISRFDTIPHSLNNVEPQHRESAKQATPSRSWLSRFRPFRQTESIMPDDFLAINIDTSGGSSTQIWGEREVVVVVPSSAQPFPPPLSKTSTSFLGNLSLACGSLRSSSDANLPKNGEISRKSMYNRPPCTYIIDVPTPRDYVVHLRTGPDNKWDCRQCEQHLTTRKEFVRHTRSQHPEAFVCGCGKLYHNNSDLTDHRQEYAHYH